MTTLFGTPGFHARPLRRDEVLALQALFDTSPEYFQIVNGRNANHDEAAEEFDELPPPDMPFGGRWCLGLYTDEHELIGVAIGLSDFLAPQVWHLGLFWLATPWHGRGVAAPLYRALEAWAQASGAHWMRLGVVVGNARAEAFWLSVGYAEVKRREAVDMGGRLNDLRVMVKPLGLGATLANYLDKVARDRPYCSGPLKS
ncbi:MAG: GNAT family N-acetyltransferase [Ideonella sp.]|nr:GNAT family N-acetyltransferase [Ideonella sp.]